MFQNDIAVDLGQNKDQACVFLLPFLLRSERSLSLSEQSDTVAMYLSEAITGTPTPSRAETISSVNAVFVESYAGIRIVSRRNFLWHLKRIKELRRRAVNTTEYLPKKHSKAFLVFHIFAVSPRPRSNSRGCNRQLPAVFILKRWYFLHYCATTVLEPNVASRRDRPLMGSYERKKGMGCRINPPAVDSN